MTKFPVAIRLRSLAENGRTAIEKAGEIGCSGVVLDAAGEFDPAELGPTGQRHFKHLLSTHALRLDGVRCATRRGLDEVDRLEGRIAKAIATLRLASQLGSPSMTIHVGTAPPSEETSKRAVFEDALVRIADESVRVGVSLALLVDRTQPQATASLIDDWRRFDLFAAYDPVALILGAHDPYASMELFQGRMAMFFAHDVVRTATALSGVREVPIGEGELDFERFLGGLVEIDYSGAWCLDYETRLTDDALRRSVEFLKRL